jgi:hypothetical protein
MQPSLKAFTLVHVLIQKGDSARILGYLVSNIDILSTSRDLKKIGMSNSGALL